MTEKKQAKDNEVLIGSKPFITYIRSIEILLKKRNMKKISLKARGKKNIGLAVDLAEASCNKFFKELNIELTETRIGTEHFKKIDPEKGELELSVSTIEIILERK